MHTYDTVFSVAVWSAFRCSFAASFLRKSNKLSCEMLTACALRKQRVVPSLKVYLPLTLLRYPTFIHITPLPKKTQSAHAPCKVWPIATTLTELRI